MRPRVKRLPVTFSARFRADLEDFVPVEVLAELREDRLSGKKCTFDHSVLLFLLCGNYKVKTKRAGSSSEEPAIFILAIFLPDTNNIL